MPDWQVFTDPAVCEREFPAQLAVLDDIIDFVSAAAAKRDCNAKKLFQLDMVIEEIFVNIAHYAYPGQDGCATVKFIFIANRLHLLFSDSGIPFDPLQKADPEQPQNIEETKVGGLGIFLVKSYADEIAYRYKNGQNQLLIVLDMSA